MTAPAVARGYSPLAALMAVAPAGKETLQRSEQIIPLYAAGAMPEWVKHSKPMVPGSWACGHEKGTHRGASDAMISW